MNSKYPEVTVIMPVFNGAVFLPKAIESILNQTWSAFEFVILDDGSTEDVVGIINEFSDSRIKLISRENRGLGDTLNELVAMASNEVIIRMDADDICSPDRIEKQVEFLLANAEVVMLGTGISFLIDDKVVDAFSPTRGHHAIMKKLQSMRFPICHPSIAFRRSAFLEIGGYRIKGAGEDLDFFLRMGEVGLLDNLSEVLLHYRLSSNSLALRKADELAKGYSYALYSSELRAGASSDLTINDYQKLWMDRTIAQRIFWFAYVKSEYHYRQSIIARARAQKLRMVLHLLCATSMRPRVSFARAWEYVFGINR